MRTLTPVEPQERIEILDVLRGFALQGIIFDNMLSFSGYLFIPFDNLKEITDFQLDESIFSFLNIIIRRNFYTLFAILFAVGFHLQFSKQWGNPNGFLKIYRKRIFILFIIGLMHSLIWFGDILSTYSIMALILILFRNIKAKNILYWSLFFMILPTLMDFYLLPIINDVNIIFPKNHAVYAHISYPDMAPNIVIDTFRNGTIIELFYLNIHHIVWKYICYILEGRFFIFLGIFLFGYYLASIKFFENINKPYSLLIFSFIIGLTSTMSAKVLGVEIYRFPPSLPNTS